MSVLAARCKAECRPLVVPRLMNLRGGNAEQALGTFRKLHNMVPDNMEVIFQVSPVGSGTALNSCCSWYWWNEP